MKAQKIILVGGGMGGLTAALALAQQGFACEIVEAGGAREPENKSGAGIQLSPNAMHVLTALGLGAAVEAIATAPTRVLIRNFATGKIERAIPLKGICEKLYGAKYLQVHRADLIETLHRAITKANIPIHFGERAQAITQNENTITLETNATTRTADVLVGADGIHSTMRAQVLGTQDSKPQFRRQVATRGLVPTKHLSPETLAPFAGGAVNMWLGPAKHFVAYLVRNATQINFVAVENKNEWTQESWRTSGDKDQTRNAFDGWDKTIDALLEASAPPMTWGLFDRKPLPHWHDRRAVLLGDACHPMLPFMAQGAAQAMEDATTLAHALAHHNIAAAFATYEKTRKPRASKIQSLSRTNGWIYHLSNPQLRTARRLFFGLSQKIPRRLHHIYQKM